MLSRIKTASLLLFVTIALPTLAIEPPAVQWTRSFSAAGFAYAGASSVRQMTGGDYVAVGDVQSDTGGGAFPFWLRTDSLGNIRWQAVDTVRPGRARCVAQTLDGGFVISGEGLLVDTSECIYLVKMDPAGVVQWRSIVDSMGSNFPSVVTTGNGGFAVAAWNGRALLMRIDSLGTRQWRREYASIWPPPLEVPLVGTSDGGFALGAGARIIKADSLGMQQWMRSYDSVEYVSSVAQMTDRGYMATGTMLGPDKTFSDRFLLLRTDSLGNMLWKKSIGSGTRRSMGYWVEPTPGNGAVASGGNETESRIDGYVVRTGAGGNVIWSRQLGDISPQCIRTTSDGGYVIAGDSLGRLSLTKLAPDPCR